MEFKRDCIVAEDVPSSAPVLIRDLSVPTGNMIDINRPLEIGYAFELTKVPGLTYDTFASAVEFVARCDTPTELEINLNSFDETRIYLNYNIIATVLNGEQYFNIFTMRTGDRIRIDTPSRNTPRQRVFIGIARIVQRARLQYTEIQCFRIGGIYGGVSNVDIDVKLPAVVGEFAQSLTVKPIDKKHSFELDSFCFEQILSAKITVNDFIDLEFPDAPIGERLIGLKPGDIVDTDYLIRANQRFRIVSTDKSNRSRDGYVATLSYKKPPEPDQIIPGGNGKIEYIDCLTLVSSKFTTITGLDAPEVGYTANSTAVNVLHDASSVNWQCKCDNLTILIEVSTLDVNNETNLSVGIGSPNRIFQVIKPNETKTFVITLRLMEMLSLSTYYTIGGRPTNPPVFRSKIKILDNTVPTPPKAQALDAPVTRSGLVKLEGE